MHFEPPEAHPGTTVDGQEPHGIDARLGSLGLRHVQPLGSFKVSGEQRGVWEQKCFLTCFFQKALVIFRGDRFKEKQISYDYWIFLTNNMQ